jgi:hypothetical protein
MPDKKMLSTEEIEAQSALELPDREVLQGGGGGVFVLGPFLILHLAIAINVCPAIAVHAFTNGSVTAAVPICTASAAAG